MLERPRSHPCPNADAKGVIHTSPGQRPGLVGQKGWEALKAHFIEYEAGHWPAIQFNRSRTRGATPGCYELGPRPCSTVEIEPGLGSAPKDAGNDKRFIEVYQQPRLRPSPFKGFLPPASNRAPISLEMLDETVGNIDYHGTQ
jgi:hypothetical protein